MNKSNKILVIGSGGREHAMCRALINSDPIPELWIISGNPGIANFGSIINVSCHDTDTIVDIAKQGNFDFVLPGPEQSLVNGLADRLAAYNIPCCGPSVGAAQLESSKSFTRQLGSRINLPSPNFAIIKDVNSLINTISNWNGVPVIKADGLAAGKGVFLCDTKDECIDIGRRLLGGYLEGAGKIVVVEDRLNGIEASLFYACNGRQIVVLPSARDHKRLCIGDCGPNTGGMGAISPSPLVDDNLESNVRNQIVIPTLIELEKNNIPFCGFLYVGIMLTADGPKLLEFNVRLGDPEAQAILPRLQKGEFLRLCKATANGELNNFDLNIDSKATCAVVITAEGYPDNVRKDDAIKINSDFGVINDCWIDFAGVKICNNELLTSGGRVMAVVAKGDNIEQARGIVYSELPKINYNGMYYRTDIGL